MQIRNTPDRWGIVHQTLHWLIGPLVLFQLGLGVYIGGLPPDVIGHRFAFGLHASIGLTILLLMLIRLVWRLLNPVPLMPERLGAPERALVRVTHYGFYVLLFIMPVAGYLMANARGYTVPFFGLSLPALISPDENLAVVFFYVHFIGAALLLATVALHVAGALRHEFILKDNTLRRMTPMMAPREDDYRARTTARSTESESARATRS